MVAGGETANIGFNTPIVNSGSPGSAQYGYGSAYWQNAGTTFITTEGKVYFAGYNQYGEAGDGTTGIIYEWIESTPASSYPIVGWAMGRDHVTVLDSNGQLWAAGRNAIGQLGVGDTTDRETWTAVSGTLNQAISCSDVNSYRINPSGYLEACGSGANYRLGTGDTLDSSTFISADGGNASSAMYNRKAKSVWAGYACVWAIRDDDALCFVGYQGSYQGGINSFSDNIQYYTLCSTSNYGSETPVQVSTDAAGGTSQHAMMITAEGNIYGCGDGAYYKTGLNSTTDVQVFTQCTGDVRNVTVTRVSCTDNASICLDSTGNVWTTGNQFCTGQPNDDNNTEFTKVTLPVEFFSKTIVNVFGGPTNSFYAVDSEGTLWGVGNRVRGLGLSQAEGYRTKLFSKVPIYDVVPKEFKYTPTLTLENPNPDYGATVEFKNPNNRAFINLDDKTSTLRLGFVDNENNAGQFNGIKLGIDRVAIGRGGSIQGSGSVAIGDEVGYSQGSEAVAIGANAGQTSQGIYAVAIGTNAGQINQGSDAIAIGRYAGLDTQYENNIAIGVNAGRKVSGNNALCIGWYSGSTSVGDQAVCFGVRSGQFGTGSNTVAIGRNTCYAGGPTGSENAVYIGYQAGSNTTRNGSTIINASGLAINPAADNVCHIYPVRSLANSNYLKYNSGTGEVTYSTSSDRRMKRNLQLANHSAVDEISKLKVYTFEEKNFGIRPANDETIWTPSVGVISQEVYKNAPSLRHAISIPTDVGDIDSFVPPEDPNDPSIDWSVWGTETASLDYMLLVPHTMKAIQELNQEIINLKTRISELENANTPSQ